MVKFALLILLLIGLPLSLQARDMDEAELNQIAGLVFHNECASQERCLTAWNEGEEFASLGIGHFIWYSAGQQQQFSESFPELLAFMMKRKVQLPEWLQHAVHSGNPWRQRETFLAAIDSAALSQLRQLLIETKTLQAQFMLQRFELALPRLLSGLPDALQLHVKAQFERVAAAPMGFYLLIDYVNFKGEGINPKERYQGQGWGLLQVLTDMQGGAPGLSAVEAFAVSADRVLTRRVAAAPPARHEGRWLSGWRKRIATYVREARRLEQARR